MAIGACRRLGAAASFAPLVPPAAAADGDAPQGAASGPVPPAGLAEVAGLREAVVVEVAKFCVGGFTSWTLLCWFLHRYVGHPGPICHRTRPDGACAASPMRLSRWRKRWWRMKDLGACGTSVSLLMIWLLQLHKREKKKL